MQRASDLLHVLATKGNVGDLLRRPVQIPLTRGVEGTRQVLDEIPCILFICRFLFGAQFDQMGSCIDSQDRRTEIAPSHIADYL
jgi:hypothetical protein